ncbi:zinc metalloprotease [Erwinia tracheiphila PSU-1]|nr:zinc metalloprotease [Erwinia tracheiphila PSU-1]
MMQKIRKRCHARWFAAKFNPIACSEAYDYVGITYDFFWQVWQRNSLEIKGWH